MGAPGLSMEASTKLLEPVGSNTMALCEMSGIELMARLTPGRVSTPGDNVELHFDPLALHVLSTETGQRLNLQRSRTVTAFYSA